MNILYENARIYRDGHLSKGVLAVQNGSVTAIDSFQPDQRIDLEGKILCPGFFDMHCHLRDPGLTYKEDIVSGTAAAAAGGFQALAAMPNTKPICDQPETVRYMIDKAEREGSCRVLPVAAATLNSAGEQSSDYAALKAAGAVALTDDGQVLKNAAILREVLQEAAREKLLVMDHCEESSLSAGAAMNLGESSRKLGVKGMPNSAESIIVARDLLIAAELGLPIHITHVSTKEAVMMIREAKRQGQPVSADSCPHYFALTDEACLEWGSLAKMYPPLRQEDDRQAILEGFLDGTLDAISTDHAPHSPAEKAGGMAKAAKGIIGLETAFGLSCRFLCGEGGLPLERLFALLIEGPARLLGQPQPRLLPGEEASFTVIDPDTAYHWNLNDSKSKARNCPYDGIELKGQILRTVWKGKTVYVREFC